MERVTFCPWRLEQHRAVKLKRELYGALIIGTQREGGLQVFRSLKKGRGSEGGRKMKGESDGPNRSIAAGPEDGGNSTESTGTSSRPSALTGANTGTQEHRDEAGTQQHG
ncbi:hypothetical protein L3Q82_003346 [Scortum barcoo]|uniref:Uncharacterized protein n=1 Tax=Scortum barcoo TaxID=214431 RepID=A0ACB8VML2_9TELE|nr:hypothetical protein L3Q82_003346 [Scortum barcoo]